MGRLGTCAYDAMVERHGAVVIGVDFDHETVAYHQKAGRHVIFGDPTDPDFWARALTINQMRLTMLAIPSQTANIAAVQQLRSKGFTGMIAATALFDDEIPDLEKAGVDAAFNLYGEAGLGFADHANDLLEKRSRKPHRSLT
jgi:Trk K+ transport system NAD-binding subunit